MVQGIQTKKAADFSAWYTELIESAELADVRYGIKGFVVYREWAQLSIDRMFALFEEVLQRAGHFPVTMPTLIPGRNFEIEADHVEGFAPDVFWVDSGDSEEKYALRPTSETAFYQMYKLWIRSHRDLPYKRYQKANVFRAEKTKMTRPFFRGREFHWIETHNAFATAEDAVAQVHEDMKITHEVLYEQFGIPHIFFERPQWDKFPGADKTFAADALLGSGRVLQLPSTHLLGQNFSKPFEVQFLDKNGEKQFVYSTCYGPAVSRIYGAMIALHSDDKGLRVPFGLAPYQVVIVPVLGDKDERVGTVCAETATQLSAYRVYVDDRSGYSLGWKCNQWEMKGVPIRIEIGPRDIDAGTVVIYRRDIDEKQTVRLDELSDVIAQISSSYTDALKKQAAADFDSSVVKAQSVAEITAGLTDNKIVRCNFCSIGLDGADAAAVVEKECGGTVRGVRFGKDEQPDGPCAVTGKKASCVVYVARSY